MTDQTPSPQSVVVPKFGDIVENGWASEDNPTRRGFFVREFKRAGKMNPGRTWEITDGKGKFWEFKPSDIGERLSVSAAPAPSSLAGGEVEGESVALMRPFWVSWWGDPGAFELHRPWWVSGERDDGKQSICAAVLAQDEFTARLSVQWAHDDKDVALEWRFVEERPKGWSPFGDRFRQADWMRWPESAALSPEAPAREGVEEALRPFKAMLAFSAFLQTKTGRDLPPDDAVIVNWTGAFGEPGCTLTYGDLRRVAALTPRHEAPTYADELANESLRRRDAEFGRHEAPAEGAGEVNLGWFAGFARKHGHHAQADWLDQYRARSSAPEAREAIAVFCEKRAEQYETSDDVRQQGHARGLREAAIVARTLDAPEAAPSADKLRTAVEALEKIKLGDVTVFDDELQCNVEVTMDGEEASNIAAEALAAMEAEAA